MLPEAGEQHRTFHPAFVHYNIFHSSGDHGRSNQTRFLWTFVWQSHLQDLRHHLNFLLSHSPNAGNSSRMIISSNGQSPGMMANMIIVYPSLRTIQEKTVLNQKKIIPAHSISSRLSSEYSLQHQSKGRALHHHYW